MDQTQCIRLIELYETFPLLWNSRDKLYHNQNKREDAWQEIGAALQLPVSTLKAKMKTLMGTFRSEKSRQKKSRITGSGIEEVYNSKWFAYSSFAFLTDKDTPVATLNTMTSPELQQGTQEEPSSQDDSNNGQQITHTCQSPTTSSSQENASSFKTPTTSASKQTSRKTAQKRKHVEQEPDLQMLDDAFQLLRSSNDLASDPFYSYGQHVANELRKYDPTTISYVKRAISEILFEADVGTIFYRYNRSQYSSASSTSTFSTPQLVFQEMTPTTTPSPAQTPLETPQTNPSFNSLS